MTSFLSALKIIFAVFLQLTFVTSQFGSVFDGKVTYYSSIDGGACGYGKMEGSVYGVFVASGGDNFFNSGLTCGACFKLSCHSSKFCNGKSVIITITDVCHGCQFFDLSRQAFSAIANTQAGVVPVHYSRVPCPRTGSITFVLSGNPFYMIIMVKNVARDGSVSLLEVSWDKGKSFNSLKHSWGANWVYASPQPKVPLRFRLTSGLRKKQIVTKDCLFPNWTPGSYSCGIQFQQ